MYPTDWHYSKEHEWIRPDGDTVRIGITDFAQQELGDIVYVELPEAGSQIKAGETLGTIESVKAVSEIFAPVSGTVVSVNSALDENPEVINSEPHGEGWYCTVRLSDSAELETLMSADDYAKLIAKD